MQKQVRSDPPFTPTHRSSKASRRKKKNGAVCSMKPPDYKTSELSAASQQTGLQSAYKAVQYANVLVASKI